MPMPTRKPYETPEIPCPYCSASCEADFVDVGVGMIQCGPYHCMECHASEIGPNDKDRKLTSLEEKTYWYEPESLPGSSANVIDGKIVSHKKMKKVYEKAFSGNPAWHNKKLVRAWWKNIRKGLT